MRMRGFNRSRLGTVRGFTIIELIVCLGVIMILISLLAPALGRSINEARVVTRMSLLRQHAAATMVYANDYKGVFPYQQAHPVHAAKYWYVPMMTKGYLQGGAKGVDPYGMKLESAIGLGMSMAMVYPAALMTPGATVDPETMQPSPVRVSDVAHPSAKGFLFRSRVTGGDGAVAYWCCSQSPGIRGEVAMADASVIFEPWTAFLVPGVPDRLENGIGLPVVATWRGVLGIDRSGSIGK
jgi:type II secretory pathway pseudopilin PulG